MLAGWGRNLGWWMGCELCDLAHQRGRGPSQLPGCGVPRRGGRKHVGTGHLGAAHLGVPECWSRRASAQGGLALPTNSGGVHGRARIWAGAAADADWARRAGAGRRGKEFRRSAWVGGAERSATRAQRGRKWRRWRPRRLRRAAVTAPGADGGGPGRAWTARGAGWGITAGLDPEMALAEHPLRPLPSRTSRPETGPFLEAVSHLPPFFGEPGWWGNWPGALPPGRSQMHPLPLSLKHPQTRPSVDTPNPTSQSTKDPLFLQAPQISPSQTAPRSSLSQNVSHPHFFLTSPNSLSPQTLHPSMPADLHPLVPPKRPSPPRTPLHYQSPSSAVLRSPPKRPTVPPPTRSFILHPSSRSSPSEWLPTLSL